jgi:predicted RNA binding protein YcfA (HicA-like mRNA interferase family)
MDVRDFEKAAKRQGWTISRTRRGHVVFTPPDVNVPPAVYSGPRAIRQPFATCSRTCAARV